MEGESGTVVGAAMKEFRLDIKVKNNLLLTAIEQCGFKTPGSFCRATGIPATEVGRYLAMKKSPLNKDGQWRVAVVRIADALGVTPQELFDAVHINANLASNRYMREVSMDEARALIDEQTPVEFLRDDDAKHVVESAMERLTQREQRVVELRFGLNGNDELTLDEVAEEFDVTRERIRQIEAKALRKLRERMKAAPKLLEGAMGLVDLESNFLNDAPVPANRRIDPAKAQQARFMGSVIQDETKAARSERSNSFEKKLARKNKAQVRAIPGDPETQTELVIAQGELLAECLDVPAADVLRVVHFQGGQMRAYKAVEIIHDKDGVTVLFKNTATKRFMYGVVEVYNHEGKCLLVKSMPEPKEL